MAIKIISCESVKEELNLNLAGTESAPTPEDQKIRLKPRRFHKKFKIRCPWAGCSNDPLIWHCAHCGNELETFEQEEVVYFSCYCGDRKMTDFYWKCCHNNHPKVRFEENFKSLIELQKDQREQRTIVFLGETGVGKSTTINHLITSINYETWDEAKEGKCVNAVSLCSFVPNADGSERISKQLEGYHVENERGEYGESATTESVTYSFEYNDNGRDYLVMVLDPVGNNDTSGSEEMEYNNHLNIVEHIVNLKSFNMICFVLKDGESRIHNRMPHVITTMSKILDPGFVNYTSFLQTFSSNLNVRKSVLIIGKLSEELNIKFNVENNIYPINNDPYIAILEKELHDIEYEDLTRPYSKSRDSFKKLLKKVITNQEFITNNEYFQIARIKKFAQKDMERIFTYALELAGIIEKPNHESDLSPDEQEVKKKDKEVINTGKNCEEKRKEDLKMQNATSEVVTNPKLCKNSNISSNSKPNKESTNENSNRQNNKQPTEEEKKLLEEIKTLMEEFKDDTFFYIGIGLVITGVVGVAAGAFLFWIPMVIATPIWGGALAAGGATTVAGKLTIILNYRKL